MLLIVGNRTDPHIEAVSAALWADRCPHDIFDPFDSGSTTLHLGVSEDVNIRLGTANRIIPRVETVWWRLKPQPIMPAGGATGLYDHYFVAREWHHVLDYCCSRLSQARWVNPRSEALSASNKLHQLEIARSAGLMVPPTLVTNDPTSVLDFINSYVNKKVIFKTLTPYTSPDGQFAFTNLVDVGLINQNGTSVRLCPGIYQQMIEKEFELRVTIVGEEMFCARIQDSYQGGHIADWRSRICDDIYTHYDPPSDITEAILGLHRAFGLVYGAYDFIVDRHGTLVFLEVNPSGQWLWLEEKLGLPISKALARSLQVV